MNIPKLIGLKRMIQIVVALKGGKPIDFKDMSSSEVRGLARKLAAD